MLSRPPANRLAILTLSLICTGCAATGDKCLTDQPLFEQTEVFVSGQEGYHTYRIPSLIVTKKGTLLAFAEGRKNSRSDTGDIDIVLRRSLDNGRTWLPMQLVADHDHDTIGNPCPVVDRRTGTIWLLLTGNPGQAQEDAIIATTAAGTRTVWVSSSRDDGLTWSPPRDITAQTKRENWTWYATGPGCGIQLACGRKVIPCDHNVAGPTIVRRSHVIYSDDGGLTWRIGGDIGPDVNECQIVELADGNLMLNMRNYAKGPCAEKRRAVATSVDGGITWSDIWYDQALIEPVCQAALIRVTRRPAADRHRLLFANPANSTKREKMTLRLSYDEGRTWPVAREIHAGPTAYSALATLPDHTVGCLYERGRQHSYETLTFARCSLAWLEETTRKSP